MTFPKWQTSMDIRMPPVASRRMYRHSATMHSHSTPAEETGRVRNRHACVDGGGGGIRVNGVGVGVSWTGRRGEAGAGEQENMGEQGRMERDEEEGEESVVSGEHRTCL